MAEPDLFFYLFFLVEEPMFFNLSVFYFLFFLGGGGVKEERRKERMKKQGKMNEGRKGGRVEGCGKRERIFWSFFCSNINFLPKLFIL